MLKSDAQIFVPLPPFFPGLYPMLFTDYPLFFEILLFTLLFAGCRCLFRKEWLNHLLLLGGNILILTHIVSPKSLFLLSIIAVVAYGAGLLLQKRRSGALLAGTLTLLLIIFAVRNYPLVQSWLGDWWTNTLGKDYLSIETMGL